MVNGTGHVWYMEKTSVSPGVSQHMHNTTMYAVKILAHWSSKLSANEWENKIIMFHNFVCLQMHNKRLQLKSLTV